MQTCCCCVITPARVIDRPISGWANFNDITRGTRYLVHPPSLTGDSRGGLLIFNTNPGRHFISHFRVILGNR